MINVNPDISSINIIPFLNDINFSYPLITKNIIVQKNTKKYRN